MFALPRIFSSQRSANLHSSLPRKRLHPQCCNKLYVAIYSAAVSCISFHVGFKHILYFALNANATKNTEEDTRVLCPFLHSVVFQCVFVCLCVFCVFLCFSCVFQYIAFHLIVCIPLHHCAMSTRFRNAFQPIVFHYNSHCFCITIHIVFALHSNATFNPRKRGAGTARGAWPAGRN